MRRARRSRPTLLRVTLADGVAPPACGDRWSTSGKIQAGALIRLRDRATVILKVFRDYNPWQGFHIDVRSEVERSRSAFVCDFGVTRPASRVVWAIPGVWQSVAQAPLAEVCGVAARMRRTRRSCPTLLLVTLAGGVTARMRLAGTASPHLLAEPDGGRQGQFRPGP